MSRRAKFWETHIPTMLGSTGLSGDHGTVEMRMDEFGRRWLTIGCHNGWRGVEVSPQFAEAFMQEFEE